VVKFCPRCHQRIPIPAFITSGQVKTEHPLTIRCGNCGRGEVRVVIANVEG
jgi:hypothetical protein